MKTFSRQKNQFFFFCEGLFYRGYGWRLDISDDGRDDHVPFKDEARREEDYPEASAMKKQGELARIG